MSTSHKPITGNNSGHIAWNPSNALISIEPSAAQKQIGFEGEEYPPSQWWNWCWRQLSRWEYYLSGSTEEATVIGGDSSEWDFANTAAGFVSALTAATAGDKFLIKADIDLTSLAGVLIITKSIKICFEKGVKFTTSSSSDTIRFDVDNIVIEGDMIIDIESGGTIDKCVAFNSSGTRCGNIVINNTDIAVITNGFYIEAGMAGNIAEGMTTNTSGDPAAGFTNVLVDNSGLLNNLIQIREI